MQITLTYAPIYYRLLYDWEFNPAWVPPSSGQAYPPAVIKSEIDIFIPMPEGFQLWFYEVWKLFCPAEMPEWLRKQKWAQYWHSTLFSTNFGHGSDVQADYVNGTNLSNPPMARETIAMRGNVMKLQDGFTDWGAKYYPFDAITTSNLPSPADFVKQWWLYGLCTIETGIPEPGGYRVDKFPQLSPNDVPTPWLSRDGVLYFPKAQIRRVDGRGNPYFPPRPLSP